MLWNTPNVYFNLAKGNESVGNAIFTVNDRHEKDLCLHCRRSFIYKPQNLNLNSEFSVTEIFQLTEFENTEVFRSFLGEIILFTYAAQTELKTCICDRQKGAKALNTGGKQNSSKLNNSQWHIYEEYNVRINDYKPTPTAL